MEEVITEMSFERWVGFGQVKNKRGSGQKGVTAGGNSLCKKKKSGVDRQLSNEQVVHYKWVSKYWGI